MQKKIVYFIGALVLGVVLLYVKPTQAGWIIKMRTKTKHEVSRSVIYVQNNQIRIVEVFQTIIFNGNNNEICFIDVSKKSYWKGDIQDFKKGMTHYQEGIKSAYTVQMKEHMDDKMSAEQKAMMEEAMKKMSEFKNPAQQELEEPEWEVHISRTHEMGNIAGYPARRYLVKVDGELKEEVWVAENLIGKKDWDPEIFKKFFESLSMGVKLDYESTDEYWEFGKRGFPLRTISYDGEYQQEEVAEEVIEKNIPRQMFQPPVNFTEVLLADVLKGMME
jgi:glycine cleavage system H lipoate-binding protein